jgi:hypothetical protein
MVEQPAGQRLSGVTEMEKKFPPSATIAPVLFQPEQDGLLLLGPVGRDAEARLQPYPPADRGQVRVGVVDGAA